MQQPYKDRITRTDFETYRKVIRGRLNAERMNNPFWEAMVELREGPYRVGRHFCWKPKLRHPDPIWCFSRLGMSRTLLADGSTIFIAGEHEDSYDPDFCIYNDVIVRHWNGNIDIYGYPVDIFPPNDSHSATKVDDKIYVIGGMGYPGDRVLGTTLVHELDLNTFQMRRIEVPGMEPGWIYDHDELYLPDDHAIAIWGGQMLDMKGETVPNRKTWILDLHQPSWREAESLTFRGARKGWDFVGF